MKCHSCGARISKENADSYCQYCGVKLKETSTPNLTEPISAPTQTPRPSIKHDRPRINFLICIICLMFGVLPLILYIVFTIYQQKEWDKNNKK